MLTANGREEIEVIFGAHCHIGKLQHPCQCRIEDYGHKQEGEPAGESTDAQAVRGQGGESEAAGSLSKEG
jgi:hypothetical protein